LSPAKVRGTGPDGGGTTKRILRGASSVANYIVTHHFSLLFDALDGMRNAKPGPIQRLVDELETLVADLGDDGSTNTELAADRYEAPGSD
jgi:hypothetical protein